MTTTQELAFGAFLAARRKELGFSQKDLAAKIFKEDGEAIAPQYLNDIEHGRRNPSSDHLINEFADKLNLKADYLFYLAGKFPSDVRKDLSQTAVENAMVAFRKS